MPNCEFNLLVFLPIIRIAVQIPIILYTTLVSQVLDVTVVTHGTTKRLQDIKNIIIKSMKLRLNRDSIIPPIKRKCLLKLLMHIQPPNLFILVIVDKF